jgi:hypothetical protein
MNQPLDAYYQSYDGINQKWIRHNSYYFKNNAFFVLQTAQSNGYQSKRQNTQTDNNDFFI